MPVTYCSLYNKCYITGSHINISDSAGELITVLSKMKQLYNNTFVKEESRKLAVLAFSQAIKMQTNVEISI